MSRILNYFSIPISLSAAAIALSLPKLYGANTTPNTLVLYATLLFFATIFFYNLDHFFDKKKIARTTKKNTNNYRKNAIVALLSCIFFLICCFFIIITSQHTNSSATWLQKTTTLFLPQQIIIIVIVVAMTTLHFIAYHLCSGKFLQWATNFKEVSVALIFCSATLLPFFLTSPRTALQFITENFVLIVVLFLLLLHNATLYSFFNYCSDKKAERPSLLDNIPSQLLKRSYTILGLLTLLIALSQPPLNAQPGWKYLLPLMLLTQGLMYRIFVRSSQFFTMLENYKLQKKNTSARTHQTNALGKTFLFPTHPIFYLLGNIHFFAWYVVFLLIF